MAASTLSPAAAGTTLPAQKHTVVGEIAFALVGVGTFAIVANSSETVGRVLIVLMFAFLLIWFAIHGSLLSNAMAKLINLGG